MNRATKAKNLLMDEFFTNELNVLENDLIEKFANSNDAEMHIREQAYQAIKAIRNIHAHFESIASQEKIDKNRLKIL